MTPWGIPAAAPLAPSSLQGRWTCRAAPTPACRTSSGAGKGAFWVPPNLQSSTARAVSNATSLWWGARGSATTTSGFSVTPMVGASGGIAGVLGAYILLHPKAAVRVFMLILIFIRVISLPAWVVLGVWIAGQFVSVPAALSGGGGVAYFAHIGGFLTGMVLIPFFKHRDMPLFDRNKPAETPEWSAQPISFAELKTEAAERYPQASRRMGRSRGRGGSVPSVRRQKKGPWDNSLGG